MSTSNIYNKENEELANQASELFERTQIPFKKDASEVWTELSATIKKASPPAGKERQHPSADSKVRRLSLNNPRIAIAAALVLLLSFGIFSRFFRFETVSLADERVTVALPDGSTTALNENTTLYYHPLWWRISRKVYQEGEAFYEVKNGKNFTVHTEMGNTEVLGTTFTVFSRDNSFRVTCHSGQVRVTGAASEQTVTLAMNERAALHPSGELKVSGVVVEQYTPAWERKLMTFTSAPIRDVFDEIEAQYLIEIKTPDHLNLIYTGNFQLDQSAEKILTLICRPFNLQYEKRSESEYTIMLPDKE